MLKKKKMVQNQWHNAFTVLSIGVLCIQGVLTFALDSH